MKAMISPAAALVFVLAATCAEVALGGDESEFHLAVSKGQIDKVREALAGDAGLANVRNEHDFTPLYQAALHGHTAIAKLLVERGAKVDDTVLGETPLFRACFQGHAETAALLLDHKASIDTTNKDGHTPLFSAVQRGHTETVRLLLDRGANPNRKADVASRSDMPPIPLLEAVARASGSLYRKKEIEKKENPAAARIHEQHLKNAAEIAKMLIAHNETDLNAKHPSEGAALHVVAASGHVELAKLLLARGADVDIRTNPSQFRAAPPHDETPLHLAARAGQSQMVNLLLAHGADRQARNSRGETPRVLPNEKRAGRQIAIAVTGAVAPAAVKAGEPIPLVVTIRNDLAGEIEFHGFGVKPTDWNGETASVSLVDIYRNGEPGGLYLARPEVKPPQQIAGQSRSVIAAGKTLTIQTDARKWSIRGGWTPGRYRATVRVERLRVDAYSTVDTMSEPFEFEVIATEAAERKKAAGAPGANSDGVAAVDEQPQIIFDNRPESGVPTEASAQMHIKRPAGEVALPSGKWPARLHEITAGTIKTVRIRYFNKDIWATEEQARQYVRGFLAHESLDAFDGQVWSQGVDVPQIECIVEFSDEALNKLRDADKPSRREGRLLIWQTESCFRDISGRWWFVSAFDHFHRSHPNGNRENAKGTKSN